MAGVEVRARRREGAPAFALRMQETPGVPSRATLREPGPKRGLRRGGVDSSPCWSDRVAAPATVHRVSRMDRARAEGLSEAAIEPTLPSRAVVGGNTRR